MGDLAGKVTKAIASACKGPLTSKKWLAMLVGVTSAMVVYFGALVVIAFDARVAAQVGSLCNTTLLCLALVVSVLLAGQSAVDWKRSTRAVHGEVAAESTLLEKVETEIREKNEQVERYAEKYRDDDSYKPIDAETETWR